MKQKFQKMDIFDILHAIKVIKSKDKCIKVQD